MKIGMIGIGDIAQKAYLPILGTRDDIELFISSRNQEVVQRIGAAYKISHRFTTVQEIVDAKVDAAFVHAATPAHPSILRQLIEAGIHVFVDKPIANTLRESEEIVSLAKKHQVAMMVGFNRRFAPMYRSAQREITQLETVLMQKNRVQPLSDCRSTLFDDFIHVIDTMLFFLGDAPEVTYHSKVEAGLLHYITLHMQSGTASGVGMMNRRTGVNEERLEVLGDQKKLEVHNLVNRITYSQNQEQRDTFGDWTPVLYRRGFVDMIDHFLGCVQNGQEPETSGEKALAAHRICEWIASRLEK